MPAIRKGTRPLPSAAPHRPQTSTIGAPSAQPPSGLAWAGWLRQPRPRSRVVVAPQISIPRGVAGTSGAALGSRLRGSTTSRTSGRARERSAPARHEERRSEVPLRELNYARFPGSNCLPVGAATSPGAEALFTLTCAAVR